MVLTKHSAYLTSYYKLGLAGLLLLCMIRISSGHHYCIDIKHGNDSNQCLINDTKCCATLDYTLSSMIQSLPDNNGAVIHIYDTGNYILKHNYSILHTNQLSIIAVTNNDNETSTVNVTCNNKAGLSFINSSNIIIKGLNFIKCGAKQHSTSRNVFSPGIEYLDYTVAIYMVYCTHVYISNVTWDHSVGTSLTLYNVNGNVTIQYCSFICSGCGMSNDLHGGGGLQIEFTYCMPGFQDCHKTEETLCSDKETLKKTKYSDVSDSRYHIYRNHFINNMAFKGFRNLYKSKNLGYDNYNFGKGGGASIIFKGGAKSNHVFISECVFKGNLAHYGGGFFVGFYDEVSFNQVHIFNVSLVNNSNCFIDSPNWDTDESGGGAKIDFSLSYYNLGNNDIYVNSSCFHNNRGISGGGVYVCATVGHFATLLNLVHFADNDFYNNSAFVGSAMYFGQRFLSVTFAFKNVITYIEDCTFDSNVPVCQSGQSISTLPCEGIVYSNSFDLHITGYLLFIDNHASSIQLYSADCQVYPESNLTFINNNNTDYGAGFALYDCSYITVTNNSIFLFQGNNASVQGGGIYAGSCNGNDQASLVNSECFIRQDLKLFAHPNTWNISFTFIDNYPNAIYVVSLSPCWWPEEGSLIVTNDTIKDTLCWNNWNYCDSTDTNSTDNDLCCDQQVLSGVTLMKFESMNITIFSGQKLPFPKLYNGRNTTVEPWTVSLSYCVAFSNNHKTKFYPSGTCISVKYGGEDSLQLVGTETSYVEIKTPDGLTSTLRVDFKLCKWPFQNTSWDYSHENSYCIISPKYFGCNHHICLLNSSIFIKDYSYCVTKDNNGQLAIADCPISYVNSVWSGQFSTLYDDCISQCPCISSDYSNRAGSILCSKCSPGTSIPINSLQLECVDCSTGQGWGWFLLIEMFPLTVMVFAVMLFNVGLSKPPMHGFVLYCQLISISFPGWFYPAWFSNSQIYIYPTSIYSDDPVSETIRSDLINAEGASFLTSIWNLNFMTLLPAYVQPICPFQFTSSLPAIAFWYVISLYPLFLLLVLTGWLYLYNKEIKIVRFFTVPMHRLAARFWRMFGIEPSLTDSICSIYLLCFTQLVLTSLKLLKWGTLQSLSKETNTYTISYYDASLRYFYSMHAFYGIIAILVLLILVLFPTVFLLLYPFTWFHRLLSCCNLKKYLWMGHIVDSFSGSFKDKDTTHLIGSRFFSALYLFLRILILSYYLLPVQQYSLLLYLESITCLFAAGVIMILRPYKINRFNFLDFLIFVYLGVLSIIPLAWDDSLNNSDNNKKLILKSLQVLINVPVCVYCIYVLYSMLKMIGHCYKYNTQGKRKVMRQVDIEEEQDSTTVATNTYGTDTENEDDFPHRVLYPEDYSFQEGFVSAEDTYHTAQETNTTTRSNTSARLTSRASVRRVLQPNSDDNNTSTYGSIQQHSNNN